MADLPQLPPTISDTLLQISGSSSIEEALQTLIQTSQTPDGRSHLASQTLLPTVLRLVHILSTPQSRSHLFLPLRLLRNLCAGDRTHQDAFIDHSGPYIVRNSIRLLVNGDKFDDFDCSVVRTGLQVLANVSLAGERHQLSIWDCFFPAGFVGVAKIRRRELSDPLAMVIYVCCDGIPRLFSELCYHRGLSVMIELISTVSVVGFVEDWIKLMISRMCVEDSSLPCLFIALRANGGYANGGYANGGYANGGFANGGFGNGGFENAGFTSEQGFLLQTVSEILNERIREIRAKKNLVMYVLDILKKAVQAVDFTSPCQSSLPTGCAATDVLGYSLVILRDVCAQSGVIGESDGGNSEVVGSLLFQGMLGVLIRLLRELEPPSQIRKMMKQEEEPKAASSSLKKVCPYQGFRRDIVAVIGNCAYGRKAVQDEVRNRNGLLLLLLHCVLDDDNPFLREWGIWTARNLLDNNDENRKLVAELEYQGSVDVPELSQIGLRVEIDPLTRQPKLVNIT